ncbi:hypothetical protein [Bradyrhizobium sp. CCBAU 51627]|uniref:hypothetical protein n=1 Tax=Bradyrhizobium sp. CCBAU 51627 TaxID=1325088 RepID=UPI00230513C6|nr:hypothetical protein [Bradyrhizobium sp. CCBAU 51627]MDA9437254.1 hypothetical protein [Bradyrhizobium sp. CCBAU 51627]
MDANAAAPAPQATPTPDNAPIAVGNYQMPRIGSGFLDVYPQHDPATGATVAPALQPIPAATPDDLGSHLMTGFQNWQSGGNIVGSIVAAITGKRNDPQAELQAQQQAQLRQQFTALVNAGFTPQEATVAVLNPEAGKAIIAQKFTKPQNDSFSVVQTGEDGLGKKTFAKMNKATGEMTPIATAVGGDTTATGLGDMSKTGAAYLATLAPDVAGRVRAMAEGRQPLPSSMALARPYWQNLIAATQQYDPTFDAANWSGRVASVKDFSAGKSAEMVRSANQTLAHVNALLDSADALHNGNYPALNWVGNKFNEATGGGEPTAFKINAHAVADEMSKVFKGGNLSDTEIRAWEEGLSPNMSPTQQRAAIGKLSELLHGSLQALEEKRVAGMGQLAADKAGPIIKEEGQRVLKRIDEWLKANGGETPGALPAGWSVQVR